MADQPVSRFIGGSPGAVALRLLFASILVGALMALLGLDPQRLVMRIVYLFEDLIDLGWGGVERVLRWALYGAVIVVPLWLLSRLFSSRR